MAGVPLLLWKLLEEIRAGRPGAGVSHAACEADDDLTRKSRRLALLARRVRRPRGGSAVGGRASTTLDQEFFGAVVEAYDDVVGGPRYVYYATIASGSLLPRARCAEPRQRFERARSRSSRASRSADKRVPDLSGRVRRSSSASSFRRSSPATAPPRSFPVARSRSRTRPAASELARDVQRCCSSSASSRASAIRLGVRSRSSSRTAEMHGCSPERVGFLGAKQPKLEGARRRSGRQPRAQPRPRAVRRRLHPLRWSALGDPTATG